MQTLTGTPPSETGAPTRRRSRAAAAVVTALPFVLSAAAYAEFIGRTSFTFQGQRYFALVDDAMVSMTYGRNLADGHGLVWNAGQYVEGYTNFVWTLWMGLVHLLPFGDRTASLPVMITSAVLLLLNLVVVRRICGLLAPGRPLVAVAAVLGTGVFYPLMYWALRGMEVGLATLLVSTAVLLALELRENETGGRRWALAAVLALAALTRDDLLIPGLVILGFVVYTAPPARRRRLALTIGGTIAFAVVAHTAFRLAYYGSALPNTYYLKLSGIPLSTRVERGGLSIVYTSLTSMYAPLLLAVAYLWTRRRSLPRGALMLAAVVIAQCAYNVYVGGDSWEEYGFANRFLTVVAPLVLILAALGIDELVRGAELRRRAAWFVAGGCLAVGAVLALNVTPKTLIEIPDTSVPTGRALLAAVTGIVLLGVVLALRRRPARFAVAGGVALALLTLVVAVNAHSFRAWGSANADGLRLDRGWAETGVLVRQTTAPSTTVAMSAAGNTQYFDHRRGIDEVGKMDPVIARMPPRPGVEFRPGHVKWDYAYSIGRLRPDIVTQLYAPTARDECNLRAWGYTQIAPELYVRAGAQIPRRAALARGIAGLRFWPFLPGCRASRG